MGWGSVVCHEVRFGRSGGALWGKEGCGFIWQAWVGSVWFNKVRSGRTGFGRSGGAGTVRCVGFWLGPAR